MSRWWARTAAAAAAGALLVLGGAAAAHADPVGYPIDVVVHTDLSTPQAAFEGNIPGCETGTVTEGPGTTRFTPWGGVYAGTKVFTCEGLVGGFDVRLTARFGESGSTGAWRIVDAWGAYEGVHGHGSLVGIPTATGIDDRYVGTAR